MVEFRISDFLYPGSLLQTYLLMRRSERWTRAELRTYQSRALARLLRFCAAEVPHYQTLFTQIGYRPDSVPESDALGQLDRIPILDKDTLRESPESFQPHGFERFHPKAITTSGTTGTPLTVYWDQDSNVFEICAMQRLWRWAGVRVGQPFLDLRSRVFEADDPHLVEGDGIVYARNWKVNGLEFSSDHIDESNLERYYELLLRYKPRLVRGHPQSIQQLANLLQRAGLHGWRPKAVTPASETLYTFQRKEIEDAWNAPVLDSYGLKEHNAFIAQCAAGGYHIYPEYGICEILDDDGCPV